MMPEVNYLRRNVPKPFDTSSNQVKWTKKLVNRHLGSTSKRVDGPPMRGLFSRTLFVALADGGKIVMQLLTEPLDPDEIRVTESALGSLMPGGTFFCSEETESEGGPGFNHLFACRAKTWLHRVASRGTEGRMAVNKSSQRGSSQSFLANNGKESVKTNVRPHIDSILESELGRCPVRLLVYAQRPANTLDKLANFPLWIARYDLKEANLLIDKNCEVTGLVD